MSADASGQDNHWRSALTPEIDSVTDPPRERSRGLAARKDLAAGYDDRIKGSPWNRLLPIPIEPEREQNPGKQDEQHKTAQQPDHSKMPA
jgi:hypothetical protein